MTSIPNSSARSAILKRLRAAAPSRALPAPDLRPYLDGPFATGSRAPAPDQTSLADTFIAAARGWRAEVHRTYPGACMATVRRLLEARACGRIALGTPQWVPPGWNHELAAFSCVRFDEAPVGWKHELFDHIDASVTIAVAAIADTGSLVLMPGRHEPRSLSLVPPVHIALVRASTLYASLAAAIGALQPQADMPTNLLLVTGPSKTADIQQTLAYGAHGPKELLIVLVDDLVAATGGNQ